MYKISLRRQVKNVFREVLQESESPEKYRTYNLLHKDKAHSGIRDTNYLGWFTTLPEGGYRKSTKLMSRHWSIYRGIQLSRSNQEGTCKEYNSIQNSENRPCKNYFWN